MVKAYCSCGTALPSPTQFTAIHQKISVRVRNYSQNEVCQLPTSILCLCRLFKVFYVNITSATEGIRILVGSKLSDLREK